MLIVPVPYFFSEANEWSNDGAKQWGLLWSATSFGILNWKFHFTLKKTALSLPKIYKALTQNLFHSRTKSELREWYHFCLKLAGCSQQRLQPTREYPVLVLAHLTRPSCAWALPQELSHWLCSQNLRLSSGIALGSDCQMACRGLNLNSNLISASWPTSCKGFDLNNCLLRAKQVKILHFRCFTSSSHCSQEFLQD